MTPKRKLKSMKKLNISAPRKQKEKNKEIPCKADKVVWKDQETLSLPNHLETRKMENHERTHLEL